MKKRYTRKIHIHRISQMMKREEPCKGCPASRGFKGAGYDFSLWKDYNNTLPREDEVNYWYWCKICWDFIGLDANLRECPCTQLGKEEALKRTLLALEREGKI